MEVGLSIPLGVDIEFNEACNASCVICPVSINPRRKNKFMSEQDSDLLFKKLSEYQNLRFLSFSIFNEPLLDPLFKTRIKQLRKYNLYDILNFHTNGTILNKDVTDFLKDGDMQMIQFNFPSMYETEWSEYMGMHKKFYKQTLENMRYFAKVHNNVKIKIEPNIELSGDESKLNQQRQLFHQFIIDNFSPYSTNIDLYFGPRVNQAGNIVNEHVIEPEKSRKLTHTYCSLYRLLNSLTIDYDGSCRLCCKDYHKQYLLGNILTNSIEDIMMSTESQRLISQIYGSNLKDKDLLCNNCTHFLSINEET